MGKDSLTYSGAGPAEVGERDAAFTASNLMHPNPNEPGRTLGQQKGEPWSEDRCPPKAPPFRAAPRGGPQPPPRTLHGEEGILPSCS